MDLEYIDHTDLQVTIEEINEVIDSINNQTDEEYLAFTNWWMEHNLPMGLQCVEIHLHDSLKTWIDELLEREELNTNDKKLRIKVALMIDSMIH